MTKSYVTFSEAGIHVDLERFLATDEGRDLVNRVSANKERPMYDEAKMKAQSAEFNAAADLSQAFRSLPPVVDDDYPACRHAYEGALRVFLEACKANGRVV